MNEPIEPPSGSAASYSRWESELHPSPLLLKHWRLFDQSVLNAPVIDLACGRGYNGLYLAAHGVSVTLIDRSATRLSLAQDLARKIGVTVEIRQLDLEQGKINPLPEQSAGGLLVFRYLHRPLIPHIKNALLAGGILIYETFTMDQSKYGRPRNPDFLLNAGELESWFSDWDVLHYFEGVKASPDHAVAQIVCRKPAV